MKDVKQQAARPSSSLKPASAGFVLGVLFTVLCIYGWQYLKAYKYYDTSVLFQLGKNIVEKSLDGARVLDVSITPDYHADVNYIYDRLYGVHVNYERKGVIKNITFPVGRAQGAWITPPKTQLVVLNNEAPEIYDTRAKGVNTKVTGTINKVAENIRTISLDSGLTVGNSTYKLVPVDAGGKDITRFEGKHVELEGIFSYTSGVLRIRTVREID